MYYWRPVLDEVIGRGISIHTVMNEWTPLQLVQAHHLLDHLDRARADVQAKIPSPPRR